MHKSGTYALIGILIIGGIASAILDVDGDHLSTYQELKHGTKIFAADSDGDGLVDGEEFWWGGNPLEPDTDGDGRLDGDEAAAGGGVDRHHDERFPGCPTHLTCVDPCADDLDCDLDGIPDEQEREDGSMPNHPDEDQDGVNDTEEAAPHCRQLPDCDRDGVDDGDEIAHGLDPLNKTTHDGIRDDAFLAFPGNLLEFVDSDLDGIPDNLERNNDWGPFNPVVGQKDIMLSYTHFVFEGQSEHRKTWLTAYETELEQQMAGLVNLWGAAGYELQYHFETQILPNDPSILKGEIFDLQELNQNPYVYTAQTNPFGTGSPHPAAGLGGSEIHSLIINGNAFEGVKINGRFVDQTPIYDLAYREFLTEESEHYDERAVWLTDAMVDWDTGNATATVQDNGHNNFWGPVPPGNRVSFNAYELTYIHDLTTGTMYDQLEMFSPLLTGNPNNWATLMHELGHSMGLCHPHEESCTGYMTESERLHAAEYSTMSYGWNRSAHPNGHFTQPEWDRIDGERDCAGGVDLSWLHAYTVFLGESWYPYRTGCFMAGESSN